MMNETKITMMNETKKFPCLPPFKIVPSFDMSDKAIFHKITSKFKKEKYLSLANYLLKLATIPLYFVKLP